MKEWDAAIDLYDMMGIKAEVEKYPLLKQYISNYHINLIDAERIESFDWLVFKVTSSFSK